MTLDAEQWSDIFDSAEDTGFEMAWAHLWCAGPELMTRIIPAVFSVMLWTILGNISTCQCIFSFHSSLFHRRRARTINNGMTLIIEKVR